MNMQTPLQPHTKDLDHLGPEVKSYIYQTILEFEPYTTAETTVTIVAKDPTKLIGQEGLSDLDSKSIRTKWRIAIVISEDGAHIEEEGMHEEIYVAIRMAKDKLLKTLSEIQDHMVSNQDRIMQINQALAGHQLH